MGVEIEHKYLVVDDSYKSLATKIISIKQGYLSKVPEHTVRIRIIDHRAVITVKGCNHDDTRLEFEYDIPTNDAETMLTMCEGQIIEKLRYIVPFGGYNWEVDEFCGSLTGLCIAEIELPMSHHNYPLPPFVGENVTGNLKYYNSNL